jgi:hypothetical protein
MPAKTLAALAAAHHAGTAIGAVCDHIHQHEGVGGIRRILGVLALAKKHGPVSSTKSGRRSDVR